MDINGVDCGYHHTVPNMIYTIREFPARVKAFFDCEILHTKPTYGGETIPISGDGSATLD